ncbi:MAG: hypothetical protein MJA83_05790 [Gammaproteobacteria bacterium]|nr:hypothetical protein [Gammaproteobacteria bacterium]
MKALTSKRVRDVVFIVHSKHQAAGTEWMCALDLLREALKEHGHVYIIVQTFGAVPSIPQRKALTGLLKGKKSATAVITSSSIGRGVAMVLSLTGLANIKSFEPAIEGLHDNILGHFEDQNADLKMTPKDIGTHLNCLRAEFLSPDIPNQATR